MNLLLMGNSFLAEKLVTEKIVDFCLVVIDRENENIRNLKDKRIVYIDYLKMQDPTNIELDSLTALDSNILKKIAPYESMAVKIGGYRRYNLPIAIYEQEKQYFIRYARFWNHMFEKYDIDIVFSSNIPHEHVSYNVYAVARSKDIPVIFIESTAFRGRFLFCDSIENAGNEIKVSYKCHIKDNISISDLEQDIADFYNIMKKRLTDEDSGVNDDKTETGKITVISNKKGNESKEKYKNVKNKVDRRGSGKSFIKRMIRYGISNPYAALKGGVSSFGNYLLRTAYLRFKITSQKQYNDKFAVYSNEINSNRRFILFLLQYHPEATTMPQACVFSDQYTSVQLLARCAHLNGIDIYVKEHYTQPYRLTMFYEDLRSLSNVYLLRTDEETYGLMHKSLAVATQTGTCILESLMIRKPCLVFGSGYQWKGAPNVFQINDEKKGTAIIYDLINSFSCTEDEVIRYLYAIGEKTIMLNFNEQNKKDIFVHKANAEILFEIILRYLKSICKN